MSKFSLIRFLILLAAMPMTPGPGLRAAESGPAPVSSGKTEETNSQEALRSWVQLQGQLHETELAIERNRKEAELIATRSDQAVDNRLQGIERALAAQRAKELEVMQNSNRVLLMVAGAFAGIGFLAMVLMAYFQWRTVNRLAEISASLPMAHGFGPGPSMAALGPGNTHLLTGGSAEEANFRTLGALEKLEQRIHELEHTAQLGLKEGGSSSNGFTLERAPANGEAAAPAEITSAAARITMLLGKGQSLLNLDNAEGALAAFEDVLALEPNHTEALVKKGAALERLRKLEEAIVCYDQAIAADNSLTIAYLYKGGLFNRMERFSEALECYEQALRTQEKRAAAKPNLDFAS